MSWEYKGSYYLEIGKNKKALNCFEQAIKINPEEARYWCKKGNTLLFDDFDGAIRCFDHAIKINPEKAEYWYEKGSSIFVFLTLLKLLNALIRF